MTNLEKIIQKVIDVNVEYNCIKEDILKNGISIHSTTGKAGVVAKMEILSWAISNLVNE